MIDGQGQLENCPGKEISQAPRSHDNPHDGWYLGRPDVLCPRILRPIARIRLATT
jgi:hypothetical protein